MTSSTYAFLVLLLCNKVSTAFLVAPKATKRHESSSKIFMATWSDSRAVKEYQEFLSSGKQEIDQSADCPSVIITSNHGSSSDLANALVAMGTGDDLILSPDQDLPAFDQSYPVYIALPPWEVGTFLSNLKESHHAKADDFIFFSGGLEFGNIEDVLKEKGYCRDTMTQVLISGMRIAPSGRVEDLSVNLGPDSYGETKWAGDCCSCGKWAGSIAERLERNAIRCPVLFYREWRRRMWERHTFDAVFHLLGVVRSQPTTVEQVANYYSDDVSEMVWEMSQLLRGWKAITLTYGFEERMFGIAEKVGQEQATTLINEMYPFIWGNHVMLQSKMFSEYLNYAQSEMGFLQGIELPQMRDEDFQSKMRQGNLRADGVI